MACVFVVVLVVGGWFTRLDVVVVVVLAVIVSVVVTGVVGERFLVVGVAVLGVVGGRAEEGAEADACAEARLIRRWINIW